MTARPLPFDYTDPAAPLSAFPARWMSLQHAACYLEVSLSTVRRWAHNGRLRSKLAMRGRLFSYQVLVPLYKGEPTCGCGGGPSQPPAALLRLLNGRVPLVATEPDMDAVRARGNGSHPYERYRWLAQRARRRRWLPRWWPRR